MPTIESLLKACQAGDHHLVARILRKERSLVNEADANCQSPLYVASFFGHTETVRVILDKGGTASRTTTVACLYTSTRHLPEQASQQPYGVRAAPSGQWRIHQPRGEERRLFSVSVFFYNFYVLLG